MTFSLYKLINKDIVYNFFLCREVFAGFDPYTVAKMEEQEIIEITSNKALSLADSRVMCIVDNAKCIMKEST